MIFIEIPCEIACQSQFKILDFFPSGGYGKAAKHMGKQFIEMLNMLIEPEFYVNWSYASWWYCVEDNFCFYYLRGNYFSISIIILVVSHDFFWERLTHHYLLFMKVSKRVFDVLLKKPSIDQRYKTQKLFS